MSGSSPLLHDERVRLLVNDRNRGKGYSVRRGMLASRGARVLHCDADCGPSLASLDGMRALLEDHDLVVGSRLAPGADVGRRQPLRRRIVGRSFQQLCRWILSEPTTDLYCGFKLWRGDAARDVFARLSLDGWTYDAEAIALARALGYRITRDRDRVGRPRRLAPLDGARARAGRPRAAAGARARAPRGRPRARGGSRDPGAAARGTVSAAPLPRPRGADWIVLTALLALALAPLAGLLVRVWTQGGVVTGGDGFLVADPLQYLNWLRESGEHGAAGNLYDLAPGPRPFVHPLILLSGGLHRLGLGVAAAYLAWKPAAVLALFAGAFAWAGRFLVRAGDRRLAVVLALFFASPVAALVGWAGIGGGPTKFDVDFISGELWTGTYLWGYLFTAIGVGVMPLGLLAYERGRDGGGGRARALAAALGLFVAWLQPWQGITFALILVAAEFLTWRRARRRVAAAARDLVPVLTATALPLVYYLLLSRYDSAWELAGIVNDFGRWPLWVTVAGLAPIALPALLAYRLPAPSFGDLALRIWPIAGLVVFYQPAGTFPFHAFQGLALPLAVLGVLAVRDALGERSLPIAAVLAVCALLIVPGSLYRADELRGAVSAGRQPFFLEPDERDALRWIEAAPERGGVLTPVYSGLLIPAYTGRETWIGAGSWTPDFARRQILTDRLFSGRMGPAEARRVVRESGARFVYADCHGRTDLTALLSPVVTGPPRRFGCARVWTVAGRVRAGRSLMAATGASVAAEVPEGLVAADPSHARFPLVDAIRAFAALTIFGFHIVFHLGLLGTGVLSRYLGNLNVGVPVFFVVSGFLLYRPFVTARLAGAGAPDPVPYGIRRALRIVPAYWVALPIIAVLLGEWYVFTPRGIVTFFGFLQVYDAGTIVDGIGQAWTLCIEVSFYVALPVWAFLARRCFAGGDRARVVRWELVALAVVFAGSLLWKVVFLQVFEPEHFGYLTFQVTLPAFADQFALGMGLAVVSVAVSAGMRPPRFFALVGRAPWIPWLIALALYGLLGLRAGSFGQTWGDAGVVRHELKGLIGLFILMPAVIGVGAGGAIRRAMDRPQVLWFGLISYSFYLWHLAVILKLRDWLPGTPWPLVAALALAVSTLVAWASHRWIEAPGIALGRRWARAAAARRGAPSRT